MVKRGGGFKKLILILLEGLAGAWLGLYGVAIKVLTKDLVIKNGFETLDIKGIERNGKNNPTKSLYIKKAFLSL